MEELPPNVLTMLPAPSTPAAKPPKVLKCAFYYTIVAIAFSAAVLFAARTGVTLALKSLPGSGANSARFPDGQKISLGGRNKPLYLADSPESLREFYRDFSDEESRSNASEFATYGMRRVFSHLEMTVQRYDADAVQVKVTSGSISGAIYWIHIALLQDVPGRERDKDAIIEPIPSR